MAVLRGASRLAVDLALAILIAGVLLIAVASIEAGGYWVARQPVIGWGLAAFTIGLAATGLALVFANLVEPIGRWRLVAIPPALVAAAVWWLLLGPGLAASGAYVPGAVAANDITVTIYSAPEVAALLLLDTLLIGLPLAAARLEARLRVSDPTA